MRKKIFVASICSILAVSVLVFGVLDKNSSGKNEKITCASEVDNDAKEDEKRNEQLMKKYDLEYDEDSKVEYEDGDYNVVGKTIKGKKEKIKAYMKEAVKSENAVSSLE